VRDRTGFPKLPGVRYPQVIQQPVFADYGPKFATQGLVEREPPQVLDHYVVLVARCDKDGNDLGSLLPPEVKVPLATFTGWNLRRKDVGGDGMLASLMGSYLPFAKTRAERLKMGDPRLSLEERYGSFAAYVEQFEKGCAELSPWMLAEDVRAKVEGRKNVQPLFAQGGK
jgi:alpha/beta hydrolase family protein